MHWFDVAMLELDEMLEIGEIDIHDYRRIQGELLEEADNPVEAHAPWDGGE